MAHSEETKEKIRLALTGKKNFLGKKHSEETKEKLRKIHLGTKASDETKEKMSKVRLGKKRSEEFKERMRIIHLGTKHSEKTKEKIRLIRTGTKSSEETKEKLRVLNIGSKNGNWKGGTEYTVFKRRQLQLKRHSIIGFHTVGEWEALKKQYGYICPLCKCMEPEIKLTEDHIIPISKGGSNYIENIQPLCRKCNCRKYTKIIKYSPEGEIMPLKENKEEQTCDLYQEEANSGL